MPRSKAVSKNQYSDGMPDAEVVSLVSKLVRESDVTGEFSDSAKDLVQDILLALIEDKYLLKFNPVRHTLESFLFRYINKYLEA